LLEQQFKYDTHLVITPIGINIHNGLPLSNCLVPISAHKYLEVILLSPIINRNNTPPATRKLSALRGVNYFYSMLKGFSLHAVPQSPITPVQQVDFLVEPKALNFDYTPNI